MRIAFACLITLLAIGSAPPLCSQDVTFVDVTSAAGLSGSYIYPAQRKGGGGAVGDFNDDGWPDLFFLGGIVGDRLFINNQDGTFTDQTAAWNLAGTPHGGRGVAVGDYNNDGLLDMFVTSVGPLYATGQHRLLRNDGGVVFVDEAVAAGVATTSSVIPDGFGSAFGDIDLDGDLDLFVAGWSPGADGNRLFENNGDGTFTDITTTALPFINSQSFAPTFVDMDNDFFPELLIAGDFGTSRYYVNQQDNVFLDYTALSGTALDDNGMGSAIGDFDRDGDFDWYVTSIFRSTPPTAAVPGTGNMLYIQQGTHTFVETSVAAGVNDGGWGWGAVPIDFDHDGHLDIIETNGWTEIGNTEWVGETSYAFHNLGGAVFADVTHGVGLDAHTSEGRGIAAFDYDRDGDLDVVIFSYNHEVRLFRCDLTGTEQNWLTVHLATAGTALAPNGVGSRVWVTTSDTQQVRSIDGGCHYLSQSELSAHFGLGAATVVDELRVEWANGAQTVLYSLGVNEILTIAPSGPAFNRGDCNIDGSFAVSDVTHTLAGVFLDEPIACEMACDSNGDEGLDVADALFALQALFVNGPAPLAPHGACVHQISTTTSALSCDQSIACP